jgi:ureidoacrylate peracid hydrolase
VTVFEERPRVKRIGHVLLQTRDLKSAEGFYLGLLGFTVRKRETFRDGRPLTVTNEGLGLTDGGRGESGAMEHVAFEATGIREVAERARKHGIEVLSGPAPGAYGLSVYLADPDGNKVELFSGEEDA